jgi:hypothetical protein
MSGRTRGDGNARWIRTDTRDGVGFAVMANVRHASCVMHESVKFHG